jgi:hypothetical protein
MNTGGHWNHASAISADRNIAGLRNQQKCTVCSKAVSSVRSSPEGSILEAFAQFSLGKRVSSP